MLAKKATASTLGRGVSHHWRWLPLACGIRRTLTTLPAPPGSLRSWLFVPGRTDMLQKLIDKKDKMVLPDVVVPDMEDSVPLAEKVSARKAVASLLPQLAELGPGIKVVPRVNAPRSGLMEEDLEAVFAHAKILFAVSIGKVSNVEDLDLINRTLRQLESKSGIPTDTIRVVPWIETAAGVAHASMILENWKNRVVAVAYGGDDFLTDMGVQGSSDQAGSLGLANYARTVISVAARASDVMALETPYVNFRSEDGLRAQALEVKQLGYRGMFAIHPNQVQTINQCFSPSEREIEHAQKVIDAYDEAIRQGKGSTSVDGKMVDTPVAKRAYSLLGKPFPG